MAKHKTVTEVLPLEEIEYGYADEELSVEIVPEDVVEPADSAEDAQFEFNAVVADQWLHTAYVRIVGGLASVRFVPLDIPVGSLSQCLLLSLRAVAPGGVLYVPEGLAGSPYLGGLSVGATVGGYTALSKPKEA